MNHIPARPDRFFYRSIHADIGYVILLLMVLRLIWRVVNPTPAMPAETSRWQTDRGACQPRRALCSSSSSSRCWAGRIPVRTHAGLFDFFGLFHVPQIHLSRQGAAAGVYEDRHILFAYVLLALIAVHVDRGPLAPLHPPRPRRGADGDGASG